MRLSLSPCIAEMSYRLLFEASQDGMMILDLESGRVRDVNPYLCRLLGFPHDELVGKTIGDLSPSADAASSKLMLARVKKNGYVRHDNLPLQTRDGRHIAVEFISSTHEDDDTQAIYCNIRDFTEQKRALEFLRKSEERYRSLYCSIDEGFCFIEMLFDEVGQPMDYRFLETNPAFEKQCGMRNVLGKRMKELYPDLESDWFAILGRVALTGNPVRVEKEAKAMNRWFSVYAFRMGDSASRKIAILFTDITARKAEEQASSQCNAKLEMQVAEGASHLKAAIEDLEAFSYSVAHHLRAPLRHVAGLVKLLQKDAAPSLSETSLQHLSAISESAQRMGDSINGLLKFSRVGRAAIHLEELNMDELVRETVDEFQMEINGRQVVWVIHPLPTVRADSILMRIVLVNLISNAVKFTGRRAEAKIEIGRAPGQDHETVLFVRDNGAGFDPKHAAKLFGVFQRLHSVEEFEGTGIGLADVQRIISRHGGRVWAEGDVGAGATFYFTIPEEQTDKGMQTKL